MAGGLLAQRQLPGTSFPFYDDLIRLVAVSGRAGDTGAPRHSVKAHWVWDLPFGRGRKWAGDAGRTLNALVGGWSWSGNLRFQSGNTLDFGNVRLVGMTDGELEREYKLRFVQDANGQTRIYMLPDDIIQNTIKAFSTSATSAYGLRVSGPAEGPVFAPAGGPECIDGYSASATGTRCATTSSHGPTFFRADMSVAKQDRPDATYPRRVPLRRTERVRQRELLRRRRSGFTKLSGTR